MQILAPQPNFKAMLFVFYGKCTVWLDACSGWSHQTSRKHMFVSLARNMINAI